MTRRMSLPDYYTCDALLGQSTRSISMRGRDNRTATCVALKTMRIPAWLTADEAQELLQRERAAIERLSCVRHPYLVPVHEIGEVDGGVYVAREFARGLSLAVCLRRRGALPLHEAARVARQVAEALDALARAGLRHGALTEHNVILAEDHRVQLTDARPMSGGFAITVAGATCRLASQAAPVSDIKALAALVFDALSGFTLGGDVQAVRHAYHLPAPLRDVLYRTMSGRGRPFAGAQEFAAALLPAPRPTLFRYAWRPAAAAGLFGALATAGSNAASAPGSDRPAATGTVQSVDAAVPPSHAAQADSRSGLDAEPLSAEDRQALGLAIHRQGLAVLNHPAVAEVFALSDDQRNQIAACLAEQRTRVAMFVEAAAQGDTIQAGAPMHSLREEMNTRILMVLNDAQRSLWESLAAQPSACGEPAP